MKKKFIIDLDDTLSNTTRDLRGDIKLIDRLTLVDGAKEFLEQHLGRCILLSTGNSQDQQKKIDILGIREYFTEIVIVPKPGDKAYRFGGLARRLSDRSDVVVIGDRLDIEIRLGNLLGCTTVRMLLPEGKRSHIEPSAPSFEVPNFTVRDFTEVLRLFPT
jgi:FMN phosphatase YigB (HAD superfamily)